MNGYLSSEADVWRFRVRPDSESEYDYGVVDGDTLDFEADLGLRARMQARFRLYGVDTAESYGVSAESEEYRRAKTHAAFTRAWIVDAIETTGRPDWPLRLYTLRKPGSFNRWLADVVDHEHRSLIVALFDEFGDEVAYDS